MEKKGNGRRKKNCEKSGTLTLLPVDRLKGAACNADARAKICLAVYGPVCGKDGERYSNMCEAGKGNVECQAGLEALESGDDDDDECQCSKYFDLNSFT